MRPAYCGGTTQLSEASMLRQQSAQSAPKSQTSYSAPAPPSSQSPSRYVRSWAGVGARGPACHGVCEPLPQARRRGPKIRIASPSGGK
eukprot:2568146-Prymnesium_polylepis.1